MYICHCNRIPEREIRAAITAISWRGGTEALTAGGVLLELNRPGKCLGCFPLIDSMLTGDGNLELLASPPKIPEEIAKDDTVPRRKRRGGAFARRVKT